MKIGVELEAMLRAAGDEEIAIVAEYCIKRLKKTKKDSLASAIKERWQAVYKELTGTAWYWTGKDAQAAKLLAQKIASKLRTTPEAVITESLVAESMEAFLRAVYKMGNKFYCDNFSLSLMNSQFNVLYNQLKNGTKNNISNDYKRRILDDLNA